MTIRNGRGKVFFDYQVEDGEHHPWAEPSAPKWATQFFCDEFFSEVVEVSVGSDSTDDDLMCLGSMPGTRELFLSDQIGDNGIRHVEGLPRLKRLGLHRTRITDAGLQWTESLKDLEDLDLGYTRVTDSGLAHVGGLRNLRSLNLRGTGITDAGFAYLRGLANLQELCVQETRVTWVGVCEFQKAVPGCTVICTARRQLQRETQKTPVWKYAVDRLFTPAQEPTSELEDDPLANWPACTVGDGGKAPTTEKDDPPDPFADVNDKSIEKRGEH